MASSYLRQAEKLPFEPGDLVGLFGVPHRLLTVSLDRSILTDLRTHVPFLTDEGGVLLPPTCDLLASMKAAGTARKLSPSDSEERSPTARIRHAIALLDANGVRQGNKAIWLFLTKAWTPDLVERFGPFDDPWTIRRWRADLRKAAK